MGVTDPADSLMSLAGWLAGYLLVLGVPALMSGLLPRIAVYRPAMAAAAFVVVGGALLWWWRDIRWLQAARPLPLLMLALGAVSLVELLRCRDDRRAAARLVLRCALVVLALAMLAKIILNARISHYGFALAMPATLLLAVTLVEWVPGWLDRLGGYGRVFRAAALGVLGVAVFAHLQYMHAQFIRKVYPVGRGADGFLADARALIVNEALAEIQALAGPGEPVLVLPQGVMINYLARRETPTPYTFITSVDLAAHGEARMLEAFRSRPAEVALLVQFGGAFGRRFALDIYAWLMATYRPVRVIGTSPLEPGRFFGILIMRRAS
jgi:hypothetical protein